jgi:hypothetical protein
MKKPPESDGLSRGHIVIMAICTGLIVANIYYCQPLLVLISKSFGIPASKGGRIAFLTQMGYALGLLFFVPLGDKVERRGQIIWMAAAAVGALALAAAAPGLVVLEIASVLIGEDRQGNRLDHERAVDRDPVVQDAERFCRRVAGLARDVLGCGRDHLLAAAHHPVVFPGEQARV